MDFVDNVIDRVVRHDPRPRACSPIRTACSRPACSRACACRARRPIEALLVPDAAIGTEQVRKFVLVVDAENVARSKYVTLGQLVGNLRVIKDGLEPDDRVIVNGLMRARPGTKVTPQEQGARRQPARRRRRTRARAMRISHFFIDRPIFASVRLDRVRHPRRRSRSSRLPIAQYPEIAPPIINVTGPVSRRQRRRRRLDRGRADRGADQRRREHALHVLELDRRRPLLDRGDLRPRHQSRYRAGAGAEPRRHRAAAPAGRRAQDRRHGRRRARPT